MRSDLVWQSCASSIDISLRQPSRDGDFVMPGLHRSDTASVMEGVQDGRRAPCCHRKKIPCV